MGCPKERHSVSVQFYVICTFQIDHLRTNSLAFPVKGSRHMVTKKRSARHRISCQFVVLAEVPQRLFWNLKNFKTIFPYDNCVVELCSLKPNVCSLVVPIWYWYICLVYWLGNLSITGLPIFQFPILSIVYYYYLLFLSIHDQPYLIS